MPLLVVPPLLVVSVHDVAPATARATRDWADALDGCGVPLTFLAVPGPWRGPGFSAAPARHGAPGEGPADDGQLGSDPAGSQLAGWLRARQERGDEISVHGWLHHADVRGRLPRRAVGTVVARGCAELWTLDRQTTADRTRQGLQVLAGNGLRVTGCTPPGWLSSRAARAGLADAGLQYVTDHAGLLDLVTGRRWWAPALCHRPATLPPGRAAVAGPGTGAIALERLGRRVVHAASRLVAAGRSVRVGLHPDDLDRPGLLATTVDVVRACLATGAEATTYEDVLTRLRAEA